jgi:ubiquinone/menaquinone biosynthesis C-methylase UbiE
MAINETNAQKLNDYFNETAISRIRYRRRRKYYWDNITECCNFFIHHEATILEIGCGTGELLKKINGKEKTGIDFSKKMIEEAKKQYPDLNFVLMPAEKIDFKNKFDVIILSNLIGYLDDIQLVFKELHKVCHRETKIIITHHNIIWEPLLKVAELIRIKIRGPKQNRISCNDLSNILFLSGFEAYRRASSMLFPFYIPFISTFLNKYLSKLPLFKLFALNQYTFAQQISNYNNVEEVSEKHSVSIVIPAKNENDNIEDCILRMPDFGKHLEIIFIEGGSDDGTWKKIMEVQARFGKSHDIKVFRQPGNGKGDAVRAGFQEAQGDILMILDADLTVSPEELPKFYYAIAQNKGSFINGSRLIYPMRKGAMRFFNKLGNILLSLSFSWLFEQPIKDTLCGTKAMFRNDYIKIAANRSYFGNFDPFGDFDLLFGAYKLNLKIIDVPVRYHERKYGKTKISRLKHGFVLVRMWLFALKKIKFGY